MSAAVELRGLRKDFGRTRIIQGVDLTIAAGERRAIIGPNGAGKSTLFNLISARIAPSAGRITVLGRDVTGWSPSTLARHGLSRGFQVTQAFAGLSVADNLVCAAMQAEGLGCSLWSRPAAHAGVRRRVDELLHAARLETQAHTPAGELAYADQRSLELVMTLAGDARVVLLDEPTAGMSRAETEHAVAMIDTLTRGRTLVIVEHDMGVVFKLADHISVLVRGEVILTGTPAQVRASQAVREAYLGQRAADHA